MATQLNFAQQMDAVLKELGGTRPRLLLHACCGPCSSYRNAGLGAHIGKKPVEPEAPAEPTTKVCPYCQTEIPIKAVRCPHCTSKLEGFPEINA